MLARPPADPATAASRGAPFAAAFEALVAKLGAAVPADEVAAWHKAFEARTGAFGPDDAWFESRSRAFWDDTMTREHARLATLALAPAEEPWALALSKSHRGLFRAEPGTHLVLDDVASGARFVVHELDDASRDAIASTAGLFDGRVIVDPASLRVALLPGAVFHPEQAAEGIATVLTAAFARKLPTGALLDGLLRMELSFRTLSRVKPGYAYRPEALG